MAGSGSSPRRTRLPSCFPLASTGLLLYGGYQIINSELTLGDLMMFLVYLTMLLDPLATMAASAVSFQNNLAGLDRVLDVLEIDGASNNGVEQVRDLREDAQYSPSQGKYKIYIIDEVHMLSTQAFNALLKILEEPPEHVKFVFATTEAHN